MRASILVWSTVSGAILGLFIDATLVGVAVLASSVIPGLSARMQQRWVATSSLALLVAILIAMAILGFLEGQLKTR